MKTLGSHHNIACILERRPFPHSTDFERLHGNEENPRWPFIVCIEMEFGDMHSHSVAIVFAFYLPGFFKRMFPVPRLGCLYVFGEGFEASLV